MKFEWDMQKARANLHKHKVSFEEAATALDDPMSATGADPDHSITEDRYVTFGVSERGRLLREYGYTILISGEIRSCPPIPSCPLIPRNLAELIKYHP
jgi:uncharacterized DUF497 family protein